ncbi:hypothetical protein BST61_g838 [Cercospora zeina]
MLGNANARSRGYRARKVAEDSEAYRKYVRNWKNEWNANDRAKEAARSAAKRPKVHASGEFQCPLCRMTLHSAVALQNHLESQAHQDRIAGKLEAPTTKSARAVKLVPAPNEASGAYDCSTCSKAFKGIDQIHRHNDGVNYVKRVKRAGGKVD